MSSQSVSSNAAACSQGLIRPKVLLGVSGSVAAIKVVELAHLLAAFAEVKIVATKAARHFIQECELPAAVQPIHGNGPVLCSRARNCCVYCYVEPAVHELEDKLYCLLLQLMFGKAYPIGCPVKVVLTLAMKSPCQAWHVLLACAYSTSTQ